MSAALESTLLTCVQSHTCCKAESPTQGSWVQLLTLTTCGNVSHSSSLPNGIVSVTSGRETGT